MAVTACSKPTDNPGTSASSESSETTEATTTTESTTESTGYDSDFDSQLKLLADEYGNWSDTVFRWQKNTNDDVKAENVYKLAVADLNRNGRLELICSGLHGTGSFSITFMFEVNDTYSGINLFSSTTRDDSVDKGGDFTKHNLLNCYKKDGSYFYAVDDYTGSGWAVIEECLYAYNFDDRIDRKKIGGYVLKAEDTDFTSVLVRLYDSDRGYLDSQEALDKLIEDFWADYEKQPCVHIKWVDFPAEDECYESLKRSFDKYEEASTETCDLIPDYKSFHGEEPKYKILQPSE